MMDRRLISLALLALLAAAPAPARADDGVAAALRSKIGAAMMAAKSFVITTTAVTGFRVTMTFAAPDRYHSTLAYNGANRDVVLVGPVAYVSDGHAYRKTDAPPEVVAAQSQLRDVPVDQVLPDEVLGGKTWGRFATTSAGPQKDQHLVCTYDKKSYRIAECSNEGLMLVFSRYDDPANVVTIPTNVVAPAGTR